MSSRDDASFLHRRTQPPQLVPIPCCLRPPFVSFEPRRPSISHSYNFCSCERQRSKRSSALCDRSKAHTILPHWYPFAAARHRHPITSDLSYFPWLRPIQSLRRMVCFHCARIHHESSNSLPYSGPYIATDKPGGPWKQTQLTNCR